MLLAHKIIRLRKQFGWSQEELAEKMNVSRQSVSKWESANSIPDLNKIILMGEIFGVTTDYLIKDEIEEIEASGNDVEPGVFQISLEEAGTYLENKIEMARLVSKGVLLCMYSVVPMLLLLSLSKGELIPMNVEMSIAIGLGILLVQVAVAVREFIISTQHQLDIEKFESMEFELAYGVDSIFKEKAKEFRRVYIRRLSMGISIVILSVLPLVIASLFSPSGMVLLLNVILLIVFAGLGVYIMLPVVMEDSAYHCIMGEGDYAPENRSGRKRAEKFGGVYWLLVTAIYIGWSLWTMAWHITWIIWPVAGIAFAAIYGLFLFFESDAK